MPKLTVCGGGNAAHVIIALAAHAGWEVDVYAPLADEAERLRVGMKKRGGIMARAGERTITGQARQVSANPAEVFPGSEIILLALPAFAHGTMFKAMADYLEPDAVVGSLPARGGFDYQARAILSDRGAVRLLGMQTLPWACRTVVYGEEVEILGTKAATDIATLPTGLGPEMATQLGAILDLNLTPVSSFLTLTLGNTGQLIHPGIMYGLGRGREEEIFAKEDVPLFYQGVDEATATILQALSDEVQAISQAVAAQLPDFNSTEVITLYDWLKRSYNGQIVDDSTLQRAFNSNRAYVGLRMPSRPVDAGGFAIDYRARYLSEDVPYGLVVLRGIADLVGVATPTIDETIMWAQAHIGQEYLVDGTLSGVDLSNTRAPQIYNLNSLADLAVASSV